MNPYGTTQERADKLWEIGGLYQSDRWPNEYFRLLAIGPDQVFGCVFRVEIKKPKMNWLRWLTGRELKHREVIVEFFEDDKNRYYFGWIRVERIKEVAEAKLFEISYKGLRHMQPDDEYDLPEDFWEIGRNYSWAGKGEYTLLAIGADTVFVRTTDRNAYKKEFARSKSHKFWKKL